jgi:hypothetical protein
MCGLIDDQGRESGKRKTRKALNAFARCKANDEWPGYEGVQLLTLPNYALDYQD